MAELELLFQLKDQVSGGLDKIQSGLGDIGDQAEKSESRIGKLGGKLKGLGTLAGGAAAAGIAALGSAMAGVAISSFNMARDIDAATKKMQTQLGASEAYAEDWSDTMKNIFANNFGENMQDVSDSMLTVEQQFRRFFGGTSEMGVSLQETTERALAIRDAFGIEVSESITAVTTLMKEFGIEADLATGFVVKGLQGGLNASDDFLDTIGEYSNQFAQGGATAVQFFSMLETGMAGGMLGTDKAADAFKEFSLRIIDDTEDTTKSLATLGIDADDLWAAMARGETTTADAFLQVIEALNNVENSVDQTRLAYALFGSQAEDLTVANLLAMGRLTQTNDSLTGSLEKLDAQYNTLGSVATGILRQIQIALAPVGEEILNLANEHMPAVSRYVSNTLAPTIEDWTLAFIDSLKGDDGLIAAIRSIWADDNWTPLFSWLSNVHEQFEYWIDLGKQVWGWISNIGQAVQHFMRPENIEGRLGKFDITTSDVGGVLNTMYQGAKAIPGLVSQNFRLLQEDPFTPYDDALRNMQTRDRYTEINQTPFTGNKSPVNVTVNMDSGNFPGARDGAKAGFETVYLQRGLTGVRE